MRHASLVRSSRWAGFALMTLVACGHSSSTDGSGETPPMEGQSPPGAPATPVAEARARGVVIATLQTHDAKVSLLGRGPRANGERDFRVVVRRNDGALVADGISLDELRDRDPAIFAVVTSAIASRHDGIYIDATLDSRLGPEENAGAPGVQQLQFQRR